MAAKEVFGSAALSFAGLVRQIPGSAWEGHGLGVWDVRSLVGHTANALSALIAYLDVPASAETVRSPQQYYAAFRENAAALAAGIAERGRQAGESLGSDPAGAVDELVADAVARLRAQGDPLVETRLGGMRLSAYLPTRTFELVVHSLDIAAATGVEFTPPADALAEATALAARIACLSGSGSEVLRALTGRAPLPERFSAIG